jgi:hypothetical protein
MPSANLLKGAIFVSVSNKDYVNSYQLYSLHDYIGMQNSFLAFSS